MEPVTYYYLTVARRKTNGNAINRIELKRDKNCNNIFEL